MNFYLKKFPILLSLVVLSFFSCQSEEIEDQGTDQNLLQTLKQDLQINDASRITIDSKSFLISEASKDQIKLLSAISISAEHTFHGLLDEESGTFESINFYSNETFLPQDLLSFVNESPAIDERQTCYDDDVYYANANISGGVNGQITFTKYFCGLGTRITFRSTDPWIGVVITSNARRKISVKRNGRFWIAVRPRDGAQWYKSKNFLSNERVHYDARIERD